MKQILAILIVFVGTALSFAQTAPSTPAAPSAGGPKLVWENTTIDYGEIKKGSDKVRKAIFFNKGTEPLVIKNARGSCGCTVPTWPKEPIMPGEQGVIEISYDTQRVGPINKTVTVQTNEGEEETKIYIKGNISADEDLTLPKTDGNILTPKSN
jgi:hypothetical protein